MSKTYRALGIAAITVLLTLTFYAVYVSWWDLRSFNTNSAPDRTLGYLATFLALTVLLIAPIISTFSVIVAAQSRDRAWIIIFIVAGIIGSYGATINFFLPHGIEDVVTWLFLLIVPPQDSGPPSLSIAMDITRQVIFKLVPAVAAVIYVVLQRRAGATSAGAAVAQA